MFVRNCPSTVDFAQTDGQAKFQLLTLTCGRRLSATHRRNGKGNIPASGNGHCSNVEDGRVARARKNESKVLL